MQKQDQVLQKSGYPFNRKSPQNHPKITPEFEKFLAQKPLVCFLDFFQKIREKILKNFLEKILEKILE